MKIHPFPIPDEIEEVVIYVETDSASCAGEGNDHPRIFLSVPSNGFVQCVRLAKGAPGRGSEKRYTTTLPLTAVAVCNRFALCLGRFQTICTVGASGEGRAWARKRKEVHNDPATYSSGGLQ